MDRIYVALDLEMTGLDPRKDDIIEIGLVQFRNTEIIEEFTSLVHPRMPIPLKIEQIVGISQSEVDTAPNFRSLMGQILRICRDHPIVAHSVSMDMRFMQRAGMLVNNLPVDTFELASIVLPGIGRYSLESISEKLGVSLNQAHRALPDARATMQVFLQLLDQARNWDTLLIEEIARVTMGSSWPLAHVFNDLAEERRSHSLFATTTRQSQAAERFAAEALGPALEPHEHITPPDPEQVQELLGPEGPFAHALAAYENRPQQLDMAKAVSEAFGIPTHLLVEAGTGVGKSLAYLVPAALLASQNDIRVVISSNTINLQDQLFAKDIPDVRETLGIPFRAAILKGRANYLCRRRLDTLRNGHQINPEQTGGLVKILAWDHITTTGDRAELILVDEEQTLWQQVQSTPETCLADSCPYQRQGRCFFNQARTKAERAHILVVNHALLLLDLVMDNRLLPQYDYVVIDEAHHLEAAATDQFGLQIAQRDVLGFLTSVYYESGGLPGGLLSRIPVVYQHPSVSKEHQAAATKLIDTITEAVQAAQKRTFDLFNTLQAFTNEQAEVIQGRAGFERNIPLTNGQRVQPSWSAIEITWEELSIPMRRITKGLEELNSDIEEMDITEVPEMDELLQLLKITVMRGNEILVGMEHVLLSPEDNDVTWIAIGREEGEISLCDAPLHVGQLLREKLFEQKASVVLTSATLQTNNSFRYIEERIGLDEPIELALDSPFDYEHAVLLYVPKNIPEPNEPNYQHTVEEALIELCEATEGRTLVLFTSNSQLRRTYESIQSPLEERGIVVYGQNFDGSRRQVLDHFKSTERAVLLGTRSFWEGVDIVGEDLTCLVIARLPFSVPTEPVFAARSQTFEDPFNQFYLPEAILRFRQGFGRLIRSNTDYGFVCVLDKRILTKSYGKMMLQSIPKCTARMGPLSSLADLAKRWLDPRNRARLES